MITSAEYAIVASRTRVALDRVFARRHGRPSPLDYGELLAEAQQQAAIAYSNLAKAAADGIATIAAMPEDERQWFAANMAARQVSSPHGASWIADRPIGLKRLRLSDKPLVREAAPALVAEAVYAGFLNLCRWRITAAVKRGEMPLVALDVFAAMRAADLATMSLSWLPTAIAERVGIPRQQAKRLVAEVREVITSLAADTLAELIW